MEIVFHIGMGKTGSSSIQRVLHENDEKLKAQGIDYLGIWYDMIDPAFYGSAGQRNFIEQSDEEKWKSADRFFEELKRRAKNSGADRFIFSNENAFEAGPWLDPFLKRLADLGLSMSFIAYMREPRSWLPSAYSQWGLCHKFYDGPIRSFEEQARILINQYEGIRYWQNTFPDGLTVRPFTKGLNVVEDFAQALSVNLEISQERTYERAEPADLVLRALFNTRFSEPVLPILFETSVIDPTQKKVPSVQEMANMCFRHDGIEDIIAEKRDLFELIRDQIGIDFVSGEARESRYPDPVELQSRIIDYLVEVTLDQSIRLKQLEKKLSELS